MSTDSQAGPAPAGVPIAPSEPLTPQVPLAPPESPAETDAPTAGRDFGFLWAGQTISMVGDQTMTLTLPLLAVLVLGVSSATATLLSTCLFVPFLLLGLPAGAIVERLRRRPVMILCNLVQAALAGTIWLLAHLHHLSFGVLAALVLGNGCAVVFFQVAYTSYLPGLFKDPDRLHRGNSRLALSESSSLSLGPMISGPLIRLIGLAGVIGLNALSFLVSVLSLVAVRHREPRPEPRPRPRGWIRRDIMEGLKFVARHPGLQPIFACSTVYSLTLSMVEVSLVLYCLRVLDLSTTMIGIVTGAAVLGYPIGNLLVVPLRRWIGPYRALVLAAVVSVAGILLMPAFGSLGGRVGVLGLVAGSSLHCVGEGAFSPMSLTVRQLESPPDILTRVASVQRFLVWGGVALGSLLAAGSTAAWGLSVTVWVGAVGTVLCLPALFRMRVRQEFWHPAAD